MSFKYIASVIAIVGVLGSEPGMAGSEIEEQRSMAADGFVSVENIAGEVEVQGWDRDELLLTGELSEDAEALDITRTGNGYRIEVRYPRKARNMEDTELSLRIPRQASLEVETVSADITVDDLDGDRLMLSAVSGDIEADTGTRQIELSAVSGDISFRGSASRTQVETVSGDVEIDGVGDDLSIRTVSGDVELFAKPLSNGRFETVSGHLGLELELESGGRVSIESLSGDVDMSLPESVSARLKASSFSGRIDSQFKGPDGSDDISKKRLEQQLGGSDGQIRIETFSGDIELNIR